MTYEKQITSWADTRRYRSAPPTPETRRLPVETLITKAREAFQRAEQQVSDWRTITMQIPASASAPLTFNVDRGNGGQPQKRAQLVLDPATGEVVRWEPFSSYTRGRQLRSILRFAHTGEVVGIVGQTVAGLVSTGGAFLVVTGLALATRRLLAWVRRRAKVSRPRLAEVSHPVPDAAGD